MKKIFSGILSREKSCSELSDFHFEISISEKWLLCLSSTCISDELAAIFFFFLISEKIHKTF